MIKTFIFAVALSGGLFFSTVSLAADRVIRLAATDWCPYTCNYSRFDGYVSDYLSVVFAHLGYTLQVEILPWKQAIERTRRGDYDGLVTAVKEEAPDFVFTKQPTDEYVSCFYVRANDHWNFRRLYDLNERRLGVIEGYAYGNNFDSWLKQAAREQIYITSAASPRQDLLLALDSGSIDTLIEDANVLAHFLYQNKPRSNSSNAGCLQTTPFFIALSPQLDKAEKLSASLDEALTMPKHRRLLRSIKRRYGIKH